MTRSKSLAGSEREAETDRFVDVLEKVGWQSADDLADSINRHGRVRPFVVARYSFVSTEKTKFGLLARHNR